MKKRQVITLSMLLGFALVSCGNNEAVYYDKEQIGEKEVSNDVVIDTNRKIVYSASYNIELEENSTTKTDITNKVNELGGYTSYISQNENRATITYNVPTDKLNLFLDYVDSFDGIGSKQVSSKDITTDYSYTQARIDTLQASKQAYKDLLATVKETQDIIDITTRIEEIDTELTELAIKKATFDNELDYSDVTITYYMNETYKEPTFFDEYFEYLGDFFVGFGKFILYSLPIVLVMFAIFAAIFFPIMAKHKKRKQANNN